MRKNKLSMIVGLCLSSVAGVVPAAPVIVGSDVGQDADAGQARLLDTVSVIGEGETRQVQRVGAADKTVLPPGTSGQKLLDRLPGVSVHSNDAFGANEESQSISLRGFNQGRLGYTLDGIPLGDNSYGNHNGLSIARAVIAENLAGVELAQGIGALGVASTSNLGGAIQYFSADPSTVAGGRLAQTLGSDNTRRTFLRLDSGDLGGFSAFVSGVHQNADTWAPPHENQTTRQFNAKAQYAFGAHTIGAYIATSRVTQSNYTYLSKDMLARGLGWDWNIYAPDWDRALAAAYCAPATFDAERCGFSGGVTGIDDAYYKSRALRDDNLYALSGAFELGDGLHLRVQTYRHDNAGQGHWWSPGQPSFPGTDREIPISIRSTNYDIDRNGLTAALQWQVGVHDIEIGGWWEDNRFTQERNFYWIDGPIDDDYFLTDPDRRLFHQVNDVRTQQFHIQDRIRLLDDRLTLDLGAKSARTRITVRSAADVENPLANGSLEARNSFLPQAGLGWKFAPGHEGFVSYARNMAAYTPSLLSVAQSSFDASRDALEPEESTTIEAGYRFVSQRVKASAVLYHVGFDNRILSINPCTSIEAGTRPECITRFLNVGSVRSRGAELNLIVEPRDGLRWYNAVSYNDSVYRDDYVQGGENIPVAGRTVVDTPEFTAASELQWQTGDWHASLRGKYTGKRSYTYINDQWVDGFTTFDLGAGYAFGPVLGMQDLSLALNVTNLFDRRYAGQLSSFAPTDAAGRVQAIHASAPRQAFLTLSAAF